MLYKKAFVVGHVSGMAILDSNNVTGQNTNCELFSIATLMRNVTNVVPEYENDELP